MEEQVKDKAKDEAKGQATQQRVNSICPNCPPEGVKAVDDFNEIKTALVGSEPAWRLPKVDEKAVTSEPQIVEPPVSQPCIIIG
jgi:hypothetical protein